MPTFPLALRVDSITKRYSSVLAVDALGFEVRSGEIFALLGPNGAGKSTTVRMLVGIQQPDSGRITFDLGSGPHPRLAPAALGYLPEDRGLHRDTPVLRTLEYFARLRGMPRSRARQAARAGLERWDLGDREKEKIDSLSKGNQQKVQFLAALLHEPRFAVLDEPFSGLDPVNQQRFVDEIRRLRDAGCTILLSAHQMDLVEQLADRLLLMDRGRAVLHGSLDEIRRLTSSGVRLQLGLAPDTDLGFLTTLPGVQTVERLDPGSVALALAPDAPVGEVLHAITGRVRVETVHSEPERLHEIFVRSVGRAVEESEVAERSEARA
jgi:ABC-2 type transport system ATP-binding protein